MRSRSNSGSTRGNGFTIVELLVALAILSILVSMAAPSFRETFADVRLTGEQNTYVKALRQARSEAIKRARPVTLCRSDDGSSCTGDWGDGWLLYADSDAAGSVGTLDAGDDIIAVHTAPVGRFTVSASATIRPNASAAVDDIRFGPRGRANWTLGTVVICDARGSDEARAIIVNGAGGMRSEEPGSGPAQDANGDDVSCP